VNIALVNELKMVYDSMGIDIWEVIEAAKTKPFALCRFIPDPVWGDIASRRSVLLNLESPRVRANTRFIELAGEINTSMPAYVVNRTIEALNHHRKPLNGVAY